MSESLNENRCVDKFYILWVLHVTNDAVVNDIINNLL